MASEASSAAPAATSSGTTSGSAAHRRSSSASLSGLSDISDSDPALASLQASRAAELRALASPSHSSHPPSSHAPTSTSTSTSSPFSTLQTYTSEKRAMEAIAAHARAVLVFTHAGFAVSALMAAHLGRVAAAAAQAAAAGVGRQGAGDGGAENVLFVALDAEKAPFLTHRLNVRVLPVVVGYVAGEEAGRLVGFDGLGRRGRTEAGWTRVAAVLRAWGVLGPERLVGEESDGDGEDEEEDGEEEEEEEGERGSWIGRGKRSNFRPAARGVGRGGEEDEDDWD